jgi:predicted ATPase
MHISHLVIKNFRGLEHIECELSSKMNVIVGPNAVGKTSILQAIRIAKSLTAARVQTEAFQTLISLGAASPHFPQRISLQGLARDMTKQLEIRCTYQLTDAEIALLNASQSQIVQRLIAGRLGQSFSNPAELIQYLQSPNGQSAVHTTEPEVKRSIESLKKDRFVSVGLTIDCQTSAMSTLDPFAGPYIAFLDARLPPSSTVFSYFPADRALPMGEVQMQMGGPDLNQQLEAHNSQPQLKFTRLKNVIINSMVFRNEDELSLEDEFSTIFGGILQGRKLEKINFNEIGLMAVITKDIATGREIELDSLSSGEKNLALTFLLIGRTVARGGIILFDEPELHLNPAVCKHVLPFMVDEYAEKRDLQFILCTHSPEILSGAFVRDDCTLLHVKSGTQISKVGRRAIDEYSDALRQLGTSVSESLLYQGTVLVEGDDDVTFLNEGFTQLVKKQLVKELGGRTAVEKAVEKIQECERRGEEVGRMFIIIDRDGRPTTLKPSGAVKILQWAWRCMDNYLIDIDVITEILKDPLSTHNPVDSEATARARIRGLALSQIDEVAAREVYNQFGYQSPGLRIEDVHAMPLDQIGARLFARMRAARDSMPIADEAVWLAEFENRCAEKAADLRLRWDARWREICDGKALIEAVFKTSGMKMSLTSFKSKIVQKMRDSQSDNWRLVKSQLEELLGSDNS